MDSPKTCCANCEWWHKKATARQKTTCAQKGYKGHQRCKDFDLRGDIEERYLALVGKAQPDGDSLICTRCVGLCWLPQEASLAARYGQSPGDHVLIYRRGTELLDIINHLPMGTVIDGQMVCRICKPV